MSFVPDDESTYAHLYMEKPMSTRKTQWITWANLMTYLYPITKKRARYLCDTRKVRTKPTEWNATHRLYYLPDVAKLKAQLETV